MPLFTEAICYEIRFGLSLTTGLMVGGAVAWRVGRHWCGIVDVTQTREKETKMQGQAKQKVVSVVKTVNPVNSEKKRWGTALVVMPFIAPFVVGFVQDSGFLPVIEPILQALLDAAHGE